MDTSLWDLSFEHLQLVTEYGWGGLQTAPVQPRRPKPQVEVQALEPTPDSSGPEAIPEQLHCCLSLKPYLGFSSSLDFVSVKILDLQPSNNSAKCPRTYTGYDRYPVIARPRDHILLALW